MSLQRAIGAIILLVIFLIIAALLLVQNKPDIVATSISLPAVTAPVAEDAAPIETVETIVSRPIEEIVPPAPVPAVSPEQHETAAQWLLQIGTFSKQENAINLVEKLKQNGIAALADSVTTQKGVLYRVRTVPQTDKVTVERLRITIENLINIAPQLRRYNG